MNVGMHIESFILNVAPSLLMQALLKSTRLQKTFNENHRQQKYRYRLYHHANFLCLVQHDRTPQIVKTEYVSGDHRSVKE